MHRVRHPITMFVLAVLAVIGIGVGVVEATGDNLSGQINSLSAPVHYRSAAALLDSLGCQDIAVVSPNSATGTCPLPDQASWQAIALFRPRGQSSQGIVSIVAGDGGGSEALGTFVGPDWTVTEISTDGIEALLSRIERLTRSRVRTHWEQ